MSNYNKDLAGQRFGKLVAIKPVGKRNCDGATYWLCKCDCGEEKKIARPNLINTKHPTRSCGCLVSNAWNAKRKHFGCVECGSDKHYAKGLCRNCYEKMRRGTL